MAIRAMASRRPPNHRSEYVSRRLAPTFVRVRVGVRVRVRVRVRVKARARVRVRVRVREQAAGAHLGVELHSESM